MRVRLQDFRELYGTGAPYYVVLDGPPKFWKYRPRRCYRMVHVVR